MKKLLIIGVAVAAVATAAVAGEQSDRRTDIRHTDGTTTTVTTDRSGTLAVTPGHGSGQFGRGVPHDDIVKDYTRSGSKVEGR